MSSRSKGREHGCLILRAKSCRVLFCLKAPLCSFLGKEKTLRKILARMKESKPGPGDKLVPFASWAEQCQSRWDRQSIGSLLITISFIESDKSARRTDISMKR